eukprot:TRINITY_DN1002_c0_g1_i2.p1 TRINITY_DN1002_c0_g1~~TRINITY_DN1002_c0_g1_i2.p1  ORF type:complete len:374 (-),score=50.73 TRINITY_DN1002_c0_g1_i2:230-1351(-)
MAVPCEMESCYYMPAMESWQDMQSTETWHNMFVQLPTMHYCDDQMTVGLVGLAAPQSSSVISSEAELLQILAHLDYARPLAMEGSTGTNYTTEWRRSGAQFRARLYPEPTYEDYPLTITQSSEWSTTVMIKMLPDHFDRDRLAEYLRRLGFGTDFDFLYAPCNFWDSAPVAYAFCNMRTHERAVALKDALDGHRWPDGEKICEVAWARRQGYRQNVEHYKNNSVNHPSQPQEMKPMTYDLKGKPHGIRPTKNVKPPKAKNSGRRGDRSLCMHGKEDTNTEAMKEEDVMAIGQGTQGHADVDEVPPKSEETHDRANSDPTSASMGEEDKYWPSTDDEGEEPSKLRETVGPVPRFGVPCHLVLMPLQFVNWQGPM